MVEDDYCSEADEETDTQQPSQTDYCAWWGQQPEFGPVQGGEDETYHIQEEEMGSVASDEEDDTRRPFRLSFSPETNVADMEWRPYMEFATIGLLRKAMKEYFIHENK